MSTIDLGKIKMVWRGAYNNATAYTIDDAVSLNGTSYICIAATTGNTPPNATYWNVMAQGGTDLGATLSNNQIAIKNNSGNIAGVNIGTAGQVFKVNSGANGYEFGTGGGVLQTIFTQTSTRFSTTSTSYVATPLTITITPTSSSSKIVLLLRTLINVTGDSYPRFVWYRRIGSGSFSKITNEASSPNGGSSQGAYLCDRAFPTNIDQMNVMSDVYQDTPNTTSAVTYTLYGSVENGGTYYINTSEHYEGGGTADYDQVGTSNVLAMETGV